LIFFGLDAEVAHNLTIKSLEKINKVPLLLDVAAAPFFSNFKDDRLAISVGPLDVDNPVGLAADSTKRQTPRRTSLFRIRLSRSRNLPPLRQDGQKRPRLFSVKKDLALLNRMGFNNPGVKIAAERLEKNLKEGRKIPIGVNIGRDATRRSKKPSRII